MSLRREFTAGFAVLLVATTLVACGDNNSKSSSSSGGGSALEVTLADYAFGVSGKLTQGGQIHLKNAGDELHVMGLTKLKDGVTVDQLRTALKDADPHSQEDPTKDLTTEQIGWPGAFVAPGQDVTLSAANLTPGHYGMVCFMPQEGTGKPHFSLGMVNDFKVEAGTAKQTKKPDATYNVTPGKPLEGPAKLKAGTHTIEITGRGDISKQEPQLIKAASANQTASQINDIVNKTFGEMFGESPPPKGAGKRIGKYIVFAGHDFNRTKRVTFTYDFTPGVYFIAAPDTDADEGSHKVPTELIKVTVS